MFADTSPSVEPTSVLTTARLGATRQSRPDGIRKAGNSMRTFLFLLFLITAVPAVGETTEEMLSACRPITTAKISDGKIELPSDFDSGRCWGAFGTVTNMLRTVDSETHVPLFRACLPTDSTRPQLIAIFVRYAESHPSRYQDDFPWVAFEAAKQAFPCRERGK